MLLQGRVTHLELRGLLTCRVTTLGACVLLYRVLLTGRVTPLRACVLLSGRGTPLEALVLTPFCRQGISINSAGSELMALNRETLVRLQSRGSLGVQVPDIRSLCIH